MVCSYNELCVFTVIWGIPFSDPFFSRVIDPILSSLTGVCSILNLKNMLCAQVLRVPFPPSPFSDAHLEPIVPVCPTVLAPVGVGAEVGVPIPSHWQHTQQLPFLQPVSSGFTNICSVLRAGFPANTGLVCWACLTCVYSLSPLYIQMSLCIQSLALLL